MKTIYLDSDFMCHLEDAQGRTPVETDVFDGIVDDTINFYRYIPQGKTWRNPKTGLVVTGLFIQAIDPESIDRIAINAYMTDMLNALELLGVLP